MRPFLRILVKFFRWLTYYPFRILYHFLKSKSSKTVYQIYGMQRSGNHAIIDWVLQLETKFVLHCNHIRKGQLPIDSVKKRFRIKFGGFSLIASHEEYLSSEFTNYEEEVFGKYSKRINVLILRDPFNLFASRYAWKHGKKFRERPKNRKKKVDLWKNNARTFLEWEQTNDPTNVPINYNKWCVDEAYRTKIVRSLGLINTELELSKTARSGGGSSFSGNEKISDKNVLFHRFTKFENDQTFTSIFKDEELVNLSERIFGKLEGTNKLT